MPGLYAWLRRNPRLVDGALALLLIYPGGGRLLIALPFTLGMVVPVVFRRKYPVAAFAAVIVAGAASTPPGGSAPRGSSRAC